MSEPAVFVLIRDGEKRFFVDSWASATLRREVMWGPDDFQAWVEQFEQLEEWSDDCSDGALVDYDKQTLVWSGDVSSFQTPRIWQTYSRLLATAWPNFTVKLASQGIEDIAAYLGLPRADDDDDIEDNEIDDEDDYELRPLKLEDARRDDPEEEEDDEDDSLRAWITLVEEDGTTRQRQLSQLPLELLKCEPAVIAALAELPPAEIPKETLVSEGIILNPSKKTARIWGSDELLGRMKQFGKLWKGWQLKWTHRGYLEQCAASGTKGLPMSEIDVLARILPLVLSTEQVNLGVFMDALGGGVKKFAKKATGCLIFVLCIPLVLFGVFSGNWTAVFYAMSATIVVVIGMYWLVARKFRKAVACKVPKTAGDDQESVVAGPQEEAARKSRIDQLLRQAKLPRLAEVEPHFPEKSGLEVLAS